MIVPVVPPNQPNVQTTLIPLDAFPGLKADRSQDMLRRVVDRKKETAAAKEEVPREQVERAVGKLGRLMGLTGKNWDFSFEDSDEHILIRIIDQDSGEMIGEISPGRLMEILNSYNEMAGLFFDEHV